LAREKRIYCRFVYLQKQFRKVAVDHDAKANNKLIQTIDSEQRDEDA